MSLACNINSKRSLRLLRSLGSQDFSKLLLNNREKQTYERLAGFRKRQTTMAIPVSSAAYVSFFQLDSFIKQQNECLLQAAGPRKSRPRVVLIDAFGYRDRDRGNPRSMGQDRDLVVEIGATAGGNCRLLLMGLRLATICTKSRPDVPGTPGRTEYLLEAQ